MFSLASVVAELSAPWLFLLYKKLKNTSETYAATDRKWQLIYPNWTQTSSVVDKIGLCKKIVKPKTISKILQILKLCVCFLYHQWLLNYQRFGYFY